MDFNLNQKIYKVYCNRNIIFKKYNREISELVRLDFNVDLLPKDKGMFYANSDGNKDTDILYIDMSSKEFIVYNEDLKKCGYYDYDNESILYYKLPINKIIKPLTYNLEIISTNNDNNNNNDNNDIDDYDNNNYNDYNYDNNTNNNNNDDDDGDDYNDNDDNYNDININNNNNNNNSNNSTNLQPNHHHSCHHQHIYIYLFHASYLY